MPVEDIDVGDIMIIRPGEKIAMDGMIVKGESAINQAAITGESMPVEKGPRADVYAGTLNTHGALEVEVTKRVRDATISKIIHMVETAHGNRAPSQAFVEKFAAVYTPIVMALAAGIVLIPPLFFGFGVGTMDLSWIDAPRGFLPVRSGGVHPGGYRQRYQCCRE